MNATELVAQMDVVLTAYAELLARAKYDDLSDLKPERDEILVRLQAAVDRLAPASTTYAQEAAAIRSESVGNRVRVLASILRALKADLQHGWLTRVEELVHAETFSDFMEMSRELLKRGYKDAAAVLGGAVLEQHIRLLYARGVAPSTSSGPVPKADRVNAELAARGTYGKLQQKAVTAALGVRNAAAHGHFEEYTAMDVERLLSTVEELIVAHPA